MVVNWLVGFCSLVFILCWRRLIPLSVLPENHLTPPPQKKPFIPLPPSSRLIITRPLLYL